MWNAVQAQRDREREEQLMQQRQQQHFHNVTTQQMFPKSADPANTEQHQHLMDSEASRDSEQLDNRLHSETQKHSEHDVDSVDHCNNGLNNLEISSSDNQANELANSETTKVLSNSDKEHHKEISNENNELDSHKQSTKPELEDETLKPSSNLSVSAVDNQLKINDKTESANNTNNTASTHVSSNSTSNTNSAPTKKEKLGGFLPNGCIFPRFKNNKHKDKDKEKDSKGKDKEKTLLNALKKNKDKKVAPLEQHLDKSCNDSADTQYKKNCLNNLESDVQKLDLNKLDNSNSENGAATTNVTDNNMFIKLKLAATSAGGK